MIIGYESFLTGPRETGVGLAVRELLCELARLQNGSRLVVYASPKSRWHLPAGSNVEYETSRFAGSGRAARILWQQAVAPRKTATRVDLYHATGYVLSSLPFAVPTVLSIYDTTAIEHPDLTRWLNALHFRLALPSGARAANAIIVPSRHVASKVETLLGNKSKPISVIPLGVAREFTISTEKPQTDHPLGSYLLFVGNLERKKNLPILIHVLRELLKRGHNIRLVLAGSRGNSAADIAALARKEGVLNRISFTGYVERSALADLYRNALMLVYPSLDEGFGLPPIEAMACGSPVLAAKAGAVPEVVDNAALLLEPRDTLAWIEAAEGLINSRERREELRASGLNRAREFTWERTAGAVMTVYEETIARASRERCGI